MNGFIISNVIFMKMKNIFLFTFLLYGFLALGQKNIISTKKVSLISLDGILNEPDWQAANWSSDFTQMKPIPGGKPSKKTEVAIIYDQEAIYIGAKCFDHPDSISKVLNEGIISSISFEPNFSINCWLAHNSLHKF